MADAQDTVELLISIDEAHLQSFSVVVEQLDAAGLRVSEATPSLGIVAGSVAAGRADRFLLIEGVETVELARTVQIAPPSAPIQ